MVWVSTGAWTGTGRPGRPSPGPLSRTPPGPDRTGKLAPTPGEGLGGEAVLLSERSPPGTDAGSLAGPGPPPSLSEQHSAEPETSAETRYRNASKLTKTLHLNRKNRAAFTLGHGRGMFN